MQLTRPHIPFLALYVAPPLRKWLLSLLLTISANILCALLAETLYELDLERFFVFETLLILVVGVQLLPGVFRAGELGRRSELSLTLISSREFLRFWFAPRLRRAIILPTGWILIMLPLGAYFQVDAREANWSEALAGMLRWAAAYFFMLFALLAGLWQLLASLCRARKVDLSRLYIPIIWLVVAIAIVDWFCKLDLESLFLEGDMYYLYAPYLNQEYEGPEVLIFGALVVAAVLNYRMWRRACEAYYRLD